MRDDVERDAGLWFLRRAQTFRFVGATREQVSEMRDAVMRLGVKHAYATWRERWGAFDAEAERHYPARYAGEWMASHPTRGDAIEPAPAPTVDARPSSPEPPPF